MRKGILFLAIAIMLLYPDFSKGNIRDDLYERWTFISQHLSRNNLEAAIDLLDEFSEVERGYGVKNIFVVSNILNKRAVSLFLNGKYEFAHKIALLSQKISPDFSQTYVLLAIFQFYVKKGKLSRAISYFFNFFDKLPKYPIYFIHILNKVYLYFIVSFIIVLLAFLIILFFKYYNLIVHQINHFFGLELNIYGIVLIIFSSILIPFFIFKSILFSALAGYVIVFYSVHKKERFWIKIMIFFSILIVGYYYFLKKAIDYSDSLNNKLFSFEYDLRNCDDLDNIEKYFLENKDVYLKIKGDCWAREIKNSKIAFDYARESYASALKLTDSSVEIFNNFANLYTARYVYEKLSGNDDIDEIFENAMNLYNSALALKKHYFEVLYNISILLKIAEKDKEAQKIINMIQNSNHSSLMDYYQKFPVGKLRLFNHNTNLIFFPVEVKDFYWLSFGEKKPDYEIDNLIFGGFTPSVFLFLTFVFFVITWIFKPQKDIFKAHKCKLCGNVICPKCHPDFTTSDICPVCFNQKIKSTFMEPREKVIFEIAIRRRKILRRTLQSIFNLVVPGSSQIYNDKIFSGLFFMGSISFTLLVMAGLPEIHYQLYKVSNPISGITTMVLFSVVGVLYLSCQIFQFRRVRKSSVKTKKKVDKK